MLDCRINIGELFQNLINDTTIEVCEDVGEEFSFLLNVSLFARRRYIRLTYCLCLHICGRNRFWLSEVLSALHRALAPGHDDTVVIEVDTHRLIRIYFAKVEGLKVHPVDLGKLLLNEINILFFLLRVSRSHLLSGHLCFLFSFG